MAFLIALLLMLFRQACAQSEYGYLNIDCGGDGAFIADQNVTWISDWTYINRLCGYKQLINKSDEFNVTNTLRVFPKNNKNCYTLPAFIQQKYLLRAGFYYGNYDNQSRPPTFDLGFDTSHWATVVTAMDQVVFYEAVVVARRHNVSVCVARTTEGNVPFISTLQMMQLLPGMYSSMDSDHAMFKEYRLNFGSNQTVSYSNDKYGRIWEPAPPNNYSSIAADFQTLLSGVPDDPPVTAITTAIQAQLPTEPIALSFSLHQVDRPSYIALYFTEVAKLTSGQNRTFVVYLNGQDYNLKLSPVYQTCNEIHRYTNPGNGTFSLMLVPSNNSNMPPIVSAMELFTVSKRIPNATAPEDVYGLGKVAQLSDSLPSWSGDPCLPVAWEWLGCNQDDPPRVTALYLANQDLRFLSDFSGMQALQILDLQNNSLRGSVPSFLWSFPNLKQLNLANNDLIGTVPEFVVNRKVLLDVTGTELIVPVPKEKKSHTGLIVGLSVGIGLALIGSIVVALICICYKAEEKVSTVEMSTVEEGENQEAPPPPPPPSNATHQTEQNGTGAPVPEQE